MSSADRDYWREEPPGRWSLPSLAPKWVLAAVLVGAYLVQAAVENAGPDAAGGIGRASMFLLRHLALSMDGLLRGEAWQAVTYALLHANLPHLFWNVAALVMFLWVIEDDLPPGQAYRTFLAGAVGGAAGHALWCLAGLAPGNLPVVGSSGAVTAVVVLASFRAARRIVHLFGIVPVPLWILGAVYVGLDLLRAALLAAGMGADDGVAVQAHLGGAAAGALLHARPWARRRARPRLLRPAELDEAPAAPPPRPASPTAEERRVDALLERIHAEGLSALSDEERAFLRRVSERYRGRRT